MKGRTENLKPMYPKRKRKKEKEKGKKRKKATDWYYSEYARRNSQTDLRRGKWTWKQKPRWWIRRRAFKFQWQCICGWPIAMTILNCQAVCAGMPASASWPAQRSGNFQHPRRISQKQNRLHGQRHARTIAGKWLKTMPCYRYLTRPCSHNRR